MNRKLWLGWLLAAAVVGMVMALRSHRDALKREALERAIQSQSLGGLPELERGAAPEDPAAGEEDIPEGMPEEFWESYYADPAP